MWRMFLACCAGLLFLSCERSPVFSDPINANHPVIEVVIIEGFGAIEPEVPAMSILRMPGYHDLSPYDSIRISFSAQRLTPVAPEDLMLVKVGPMCYKSVVVSAPVTDLSVLVKRTDLSKPGMCAISFFSTGPDAAFHLTGLRVVGWTVQ